MSTWKRTTFTTRKNSLGTENIDWNEVFVKISVAKDGESVKRTIRFLQEPTPFRVHWNRKRNPETKETYASPFPDAADNKRKTRVCHKNYVKNVETGEWVLLSDKPCPWCEQGYNVQRRVACNVIDRTDADDHKIKILDVPDSALDTVFEWIERAEQKGLENSDPASWKKSAPDFILTVKKSGQKTDYTMLHDDSAPLTPEDAKLIKELSERLTPEEEKEDGKVVSPRLWPLEIVTQPREEKKAAPVEPNKPHASSVSNVHAEEEVSFAPASDEVEEEEEAVISTEEDPFTW